MGQGLTNCGMTENRDYVCYCYGSACGGGGGGGGEGACDPDNLAPECC